MKNNKKEFDFFVNDYSNNGDELLIDTLSFNSITEAIEHMRKHGYNRVDYAEIEIR
ncbi:MAG TPA: hypothetical protein GXZ90_01990 [Clostridiales bacterium]|nr:hypothetical protein [Clostridiales bacterium]